MEGAAPFAFIQPFHSTKPKTKKTFFLICFHFICWFSKWNGSELKSIITVRLPAPFLLHFYNNWRNWERNERATAASQFNKPIKHFIPLFRMGGMIVWWLLMALAALCGVWCWLANSTKQRQEERSPLLVLGLWLSLLARLGARRAAPQKKKTSQTKQNQQGASDDRQRNQLNKVKLSGVEGLKESADGGSQTTFMNQLKIDEWICWRCLLHQTAPQAAHAAR